MSASREVFIGAGIWFKTLQCYTENVIFKVAQLTLESDLSFQQILTKESHLHT